MVRALHTIQLTIQELYMNSGIPVIVKYDYKVHYDFSEHETEVRSSIASGKAGKEHTRTLVCRALCKVIIIGPDARILRKGEEAMYLTRAAMYNENMTHGRLVISFTDNWMEAIRARFTLSWKFDLFRGFESKWNSMKRDLEDISGEPLGDEFSVDPRRYLLARIAKEKPELAKDLEYIWFQHMGENLPEKGLEDEVIEKPYEVVTKGGKVKPKRKTKYELALESLNDKKVRATIDRLLEESSAEILESYNKSSDKAPVEFMPDVKIVPQKEGDLDWERDVRDEQLKNNSKVYSSSEEYTDDIKKYSSTPSIEDYSENESEEENFDINFRGSTLEKDNNLNPNKESSDDISEEGTDAVESRKDF